MITTECESKGITFNKICSRCENRTSEIVYLERTEIKGVFKTRSYCRKCAEVWALVLFNDLQRVILELNQDESQAGYSNFLDHWNHRMGREVLDFDNTFQQ